MLKIFFLIALFFCFKVHTYAQDGSGFVLHGKIEGLEDGTNIYLTTNRGKDTVARCISKKEGFVFKGRINLGTNAYFIKLDTLISKKPSVALLLVNSKMTLTGKMNVWPSLHLVGSEPHNEYIEVNKLFAEWNKGLSDNISMLDKAYTSLALAKNATDSNSANLQVKEFLEKKKMLENRRKSLSRKYIEEHLRSLYIAHLILTMEGVFDFPEMKMLYDELSPDAKKSFFGVALNDRLKIGEVKEGSIVGDFSKRNVDGDLLSLKEVVSKGEFTLLDFWASWCRPCRDETPNVRKAYALFHDKGFNVLSITMDTNETDWKKAIIKDTMPWYHMIDTKNNSVATAFNIKSIPATFLLDKKGKIIATDLRGEELIEKLRRLINR
ncbi:TlpA disulfide reductase family protein [Chitinophaga defluvii]|uniref:TlpA disulfide reductase family protein n=1 Tax=Chitinophaga defluvii TaxID=3163343 RepID=A0ABV2TAV1_9BACT